MQAVFSTIRQPTIARRDPNCEMNQAELLQRLLLGGSVPTLDIKQQLRPAMMFNFRYQPYLTPSNVA